MMRRLAAAVASVWAVLAVALVIALGHRPATAGQSAAAVPAMLVVRQPNGTLTLLPTAAHATTQTSGAAATTKVATLSPSGQLVPPAANAPANHATTRSS